ncbi:MAG: protein kinase, partial [Micromonosporaceae bacterium]|nr:protein kinase [Micromonosporaceae bacterium]
MGGHTLNSQQPSPDRTEAVTLPSPTSGGAGTPRRLVPGDQVGDWTVETHLGSGGQSDVYSVYGILDGVPRRLALKLVAVPQRPDAAESLLREAYAMATFNHPFLLRAHAVWQVPPDEPGGPAVALLLPMAETTLAAHLRRTSATPDERAAYRGATGLAEALAYLHRRRKPDGSDAVVHNDVKPENVLQVGGAWLLADLGIASAPGGGGIAAGVGTPSFLAPEYLADPPAAKHPQGDVWALGVLLHQWLTGRHPFPGGTPRERAVAVRDGGEPELAITDGSGRELVAAMLAREPDRRPRAVVVARRLRALAGRRSRAPRLRSLWRSRSVLAATATLVGVAAGWGTYAAFLAPAATVPVPSYGVARSITPGQSVPVRTQPRTSAATAAILPDGA